MDDKELHAFCEAWRDWCRTRKYYVPPGAKNILARMQPSRSGAPPDAVVSSELNYFNMAVRTLAESGDVEAECFIDQYWYQTRPVKLIAAKLGVSRVTYYARSRRFARRALSLGLSYKQLQAKMQEQGGEEVVVD